MMTDSPEKLIERGGGQIVDLTKKQPRRPSDPIASDEAPEGSDEALAVAFALRYADELRYIATRGTWMVWDSHVWRPDDTLSVLNRARLECRAASLGLPSNGRREALAVASAKTVGAVERLARADRRLAATVAQFDADPWLLNTPAGVIDLRTQRVHPPAPSFNMTRSTAVSPGGDCPLWHSVVSRVTGGNVELQKFLQRVFGYCLTGLVSEHALFFVHGLGGNGKGIFVNTVGSVLGTYAAAAAMEVFTASSGDRHPTELAMLHGARLVTAQETEEGRRWAESRIKALTGGDPITARFMRQDFFTFQPHFKLVLVGNHKPHLRNVDDAIRRRFHLVPFEAKIPESERDPQLFEKLRPEYPGILQWMLDGCAAWQREGLGSPDVVRCATDDYLAGEDAIGQWLAECCELGGFDAGSSLLYASWRAWADQAGEYAGSQKSFVQQLENRGFEKKIFGRAKRAGFIGLRLVQSADEPLNWWQQ